MLKNGLEYAHYGITFAWYVAILPKHVKKHYS